MTRALLALPLPLLALAIAPAAHAVTLPKGTPYAAEVKAVVTGTVTVDVTDSTRIENVCEDQPALASQQQQLVLNWKATFPQVTVPVADSTQLGRAFQKLHVPVTPTARGTGGLASGRYDITGTNPSGAECDSITYGTTGALTAPSNTPLVNEKHATTDVGGVKGQRTLVGFYLGIVGAASPAQIDSKDTSTTTDALTLANNSFSKLPQPDVDTINNPAPEYNGFTLDLPIERFRPLVRQDHLSLDLADNGGNDCGTRTDPGVSSETCTETRDIKYTVELKRRMLYKTKRAYPR